MPRFQVDAEEKLLDALKRHLPGWKIATLKQRLKHGLVLCDNRPVSSGAVLVTPGTLVEITSKPRSPVTAALPYGAGEPPLDILYADSALIAVDKPSGLLSVASEREKHLTAVRLLREWLAGDENSAKDIHAAHRLDRDASGVLLLTRSLALKRAVTASWTRFEKIYLAVVDGEPAAEEGTLDSPLWEDKGLFVRVANPGTGEDALTHYRVVKSAGGRSLLEVRLGTGRKHQIRVHLAGMGCPIVGDRRYGVSKAPRLALHAKTLALFHPEDGRRLEISAPKPPLFTRLLKISGEVKRKGRR